MSTASFINPYELLGVTINSSQEELKRRYYELSLIMHPDKGGSAEDMCSLHAAYHFIKHEISQIKKDVTVEQLEKEFKDYCEAQEKATPKFGDIFAEAFDLPKFNEYVEATKQNYAEEEWMKASLDGGYGGVMEQSEFATTTDGKCNLTSIKYNDKETGTVKTNFDMVCYKDNVVEQGYSENIYDLVVGNKGLDNYTMTMNGLGMSDYREAFASVDPSTFPNQEPKQRTLEDIQKERDETDYKDETQLKGYTWSFEGFIDKARKRVTNMLRLS